MLRIDSHFKMSSVFNSGLAVSLLMLTACVAPYTSQELEIVDDAFQTGNTSQLRGRTKYLYQRKARRLRIEYAAQNLDPSSLDYHDLRLYEKEVAKLDRNKLEADLERKRLAAAREKERLTALEEERVAAAAAEREAKRLAASESARLVREKEQQRLQKIAEEKAYRAKIAEPLHAEWNEDIDKLEDYFKSNDFEPANRLASVYARTVQLLVNGSADTDQISEFFADLTVPEQADYRRLFTDETGVELVSDFWAKHERADSVPTPGSN